MAAFLGLLITGPLATAQEIIDQSFNPPTIGDPASIIRTVGPREMQAQTFTAGRAGTLSRIDVFISRPPTTGIPLGMLFELRRTTPDGVPDQQSTALTSRTLYGSSIPTSPGFVSVDLRDAGVRVDPGQSLAIVLGSETSLSGGGNWYAGSAASGGAFSRTKPSTPLGVFGPWTPANAKLGFRTFLMVEAADPPSIISPPQALIVTEGTGASFTVVAGGTPPFAYQWRRNGVNLSGATHSTITLSAAQVGDSGLYDVVVSNGAGLAISGTARLSIQRPKEVPCADGVFRASRVFYECIGDEWHLVQVDTYACPPSQLPREFRVEDIPTGQPCSAPPPPIERLPLLQLRGDLNCQAPMLIGEMSVVECENGYWIEKRYLVHQCLDLTRRVSPSSTPPRNTGVPCNEPQPLASFVPQRTLSIERQPGGVQVSWPASAVDFALEASSDCTGTATWRPAQGSPSLVAGRYVVATDALSGRTFFRLRERSTPGTEDLLMDSSAIPAGLIPTGGFLLLPLRDPTAPERQEGEVRLNLLEGRCEIDPDGNLHLLGRIELIDVSASFERGWIAVAMRFQADLESAGGAVKLSGFDAQQHLLAESVFELMPDRTEHDGEIRGEAGQMLSRVEISSTTPVRVPIQGLSIRKEVLKWWFTWWEAYGAYEMIKAWITSPHHYPVLEHEAREQVINQTVLLTCEAKKKLAKWLREQARELRARAEELRQAGNSTAADMAENQANGMDWAADQALAGC
jgi:hypothetical protein